MLDQLESSLPTRHILTLSLAVLPLGLACAALPLPASLTGTWSSTGLQYADSTRKLELYLGTNGVGVLFGLVNPTKGAQIRRQFGAMPILATLEGDVLVTRPLPPDEKDAAALARMSARMTLTCHYDSVGSALTCTDPNGVKMDLQRQSENLTAELVEALTILRSQAPSKYWPPSPPDSNDR
jgi:hypothetical protein